MTCRPGSSPDLLSHATPPHKYQPRPSGGQLVSVLALVYSTSMLAFRPTIMLTLPSMLRTLDLSQRDAGMLLSLCQVTYMIAKPATLVLSDSIDPQVLLLGSLWSSAACCAAISASKQLWHLQISFIGLMLCQAPHMGATSKLLTSRFSAADRGSAFSVVISCCNLVSIAIPHLVNTMVALYSWQWVYVAAGVLLSVSALVAAPTISGSTSTGENGVNDSGGSGSFRGMLASGVIWGLGATTFLVYLVRLGFEGWIGTLLSQKMSPEEATHATSWILVCWNCGGLAGTALVGPISDWLGGAVLRVLFGASVVLWLSVWCFHELCKHNTLEFGWWGLAHFTGLMGAAVYSQRVLSTLAARAHAPVHVAGRVDAVVSVMAELGGAMAGYPLVSVITSLGSWDYFSLCLLCVSIIIIPLNASLWARYECNNHNTKSKQS